MPYQIAHIPLNTIFPFWLGHNISTANVTTVDVDISNIFSYSNQAVYSYAAERDDTLVKFTC